MKFRRPLLIFFGLGLTLTGGLLFAYRAIEPRIMPALATRLRAEVWARTGYQVDFDSLQLGFRHFSLALEIQRLRLREADRDPVIWEAKETSFTVDLVKLFRTRKLDRVQGNFRGAELRLPSVPLTFQDFAGRFTLELASPPVGVAHVEIETGTVRHKDFDFPVTAIQGSLTVSPDALSSDALHAQVDGQPLQTRLSVSWGRSANSPSTFSSSRVQLEAQGFLTDAILNSLWPATRYGHPLVTGQSRFTGTFTLDSAKRHDPLELHVESSLSGMQIQAPAPFGKEAAQAAALSLHGVGNATQSLRLEAHYQAPPNGTRTRDEWHLRDELHWNARSLHHELSLDITATQADGGAWANWYDHAFLQPAALPGSRVRADLRALSLRVERVEAPGGALADLRMELQAPTSGQYKINLAADRLRGTAEFDPRPRPGRLTVRLERWDVDPAPPPEAGATTSVSTAIPDPGSWPSLDLQCQDLRLRGRRLGVLSLRAEHADAHRLLLTKASLNRSGLRLRLEGGSWQRIDHADASSVWGWMETDDAQVVSQTLGYRPVAQGAARIGFDLQSTSSPFAVGRSPWTGSATLEAAQGSLLDPNPVFQKIATLLSLELFDMLGRKLDYRRLRAELRFHEKQISFDSSYLDLHAARLAFRGSYDRDSRQLVGKLRVLPRLTGSFVPYLLGTLSLGAVGSVEALEAWDDSLLNRHLAWQLDVHETVPIPPTLPN
jgi:uncharacterized protein YhdP